MSIYILVSLGLIEGVCLGLLWDWSRRLAVKADLVERLTLGNISRRKLLDGVLSDLNMPPLRLAYDADRHTSLENCTSSPSSFVCGGPPLIPTDCEPEPANERE